MREIWAVLWYQNLQSLKKIEKNRTGLLYLAGPHPYGIPDRILVSITLLVFSTEEKFYSNFTLSWHVSIVDDR